MTTTGLNRNILDKYYTNSEIAIECVNKFRAIIPLLESDIIIEPSAGGGVFINPLRALSAQIYLYDIQPEHPEIIQQD